MSDNKEAAISSSENKKVDEKTDKKDPLLEFTCCHMTCSFSLYYCRGTIKTFTEPGIFFYKDQLPTNWRQLLSDAIKIHVKKTHAQWFIFDQINPAYEVKNAWVDDVFEIKYNPVYGLPVNTFIF